MIGRRSFLLAAALVMTACAPATTPSAPTATKPQVTPTPAPAPARRDGQVFESTDFIVTFARQGDTPGSLAARFLGDERKAWMIADYNDRTTFEPDQEVIIPKHQWSPSGVFANGYQLVPVLCYHNLAPEAKGRLVLAVSSFEQQMQYLASEGYRVVSLDALVAYTALGGQLPRKSVVLTFDDGYRSFLQYAYPILTKHGFTATLFVYTDYVGSRNAMSWDDLRRLSDEGFTIGAHSKSHNDLRRHQGETAEAFGQRMQAELAQPLQLFRARLGREPKFLAYPYGAHDDDVVRKVQDFGYAAAFSVRREGNASFAYPLRMRRSQIYAEMSLKDFARNLNVFHQEPVLGGKSQ
jgi:peptidoglycan/xylan/chitin deacetylase (PgdA/CDA1 family)